MKHATMIMLVAVLACSCGDETKVETTGKTPVEKDEIKIKIEDCWTGPSQAVIVTSMDTEKQTVVMPNGVAVEMLKVKFTDPATDIPHEFSIDPKDPKASYFKSVKGRRCILVLHRQALQQRSYLFSAIIPVDK